MVNGSLVLSLLVPILTTGLDNFVVCNWPYVTRMTPLMIIFEKRMRASRLNTCQVLVFFFETASVVCFTATAKNKMGGQS